MFGGPVIIAGTEHDTFGCRAPTQHLRILVDAGYQDIGAIRPMGMSGWKDNGSDDLQLDHTMVPLVFRVKPDRRAVLRQVYLSKSC